MEVTDFARVNVHVQGPSGRAHLLDSFACPLGLAACASSSWMRLLRALDLAIATRSRKQAIAPFISQSAK